MSPSINSCTRCFTPASLDDFEYVPPCQVLAQLARDGSAKVLQAKICKTQDRLGREGVDREIISCEYGGRGSWSALHCAVMLGRAEVLRVLLESGADPNALDDPRNTPLHHAASGGHARAVFVLMQAGADQLLMIGFGTTPMAKAKSDSWETPLVLQCKAYIRRMLQDGIAGVSWEELPAKQAWPEFQKQLCQQESASDMEDSDLSAFCAWCPRRSFDCFSVSALDRTIAHQCAFASLDSVHLAWNVWFFRTLQTVQSSGCCGASCRGCPEPVQAAGLRGEPWRLR